MLSVRVLVRGQPRVAGRRSRRSIASSTVASASTATMSGRGSITSRTTVSPNSKIEWMSSRSSVSIDVLLGGDVGHREDVGLGDERAVRAAPCPGSTTFARPMKPRDRSRSGGKSVTNDEQRRDRRARRARCAGARTSSGTTSNEREHDEDLDEDADRDAGGAERRLEHACRAASRRSSGSRARATGCC